jgi:hypothetical protein
MSSLEPHHIIHVAHGGQEALGGGRLVFHFADQRFDAGDEPDDLFRPQVEPEPRGPDEPLEPPP